MKRNPIENVTQKLVKLIKDNHIVLRIVGRDSMLGGPDSLIMYNLAVETNGMYVFTQDNEKDVSYNSFYWSVYVPTYWYFFYVENVEVVGKGAMGLPPFTINGNEQDYSVYAEMNVENHGGVQSVFIFQKSIPLRKRRRTLQLI